MAQHTLYGLDVGSGADGDGCRCVTKIVTGQRGDAGIPQCSCVPTMVFRGLLTQVAARGRGEHQVLGILTFALLFDGLHYLLWNGNVPYLPCFRSSLKMFSARTHPTQAHLKPAVLDVHMLDAQCSRRPIEGRRSPVSRSKLGNCRTHWQG